MAISIKVDEAVQEWMKKKNRTVITVSLKATRTCCVSAEDVNISYKNPQNNNYLLIQQNSLFIYLAKGLPLKKNELHLSMMGKSIFSSIHIEGLRVQ
ncbi:hypothetical protein MKC07_002385 [Listeria monocytogenes]|jgi:hypothetical protein|uniref:Fe-S cluster assembly iron-binding protein IscA n=1 Tax=Carnobacterium viridans TaxID=174587 RepID=A0A1H0ZV07_9LACT|nr:hypothetical protein [Carnobacterium viridans]EJB2513366.1 hypothetical protein [Listeria monocytogenes]EJB2521778.1 hypothetical protein [Listeria monocytogenes]EJB2690110.1 hypothetical protein [Listeria monocytogenes]EJE4583064.1 hypothetical protein [Listeria monocytogenes]EJE4647006.1 hypothetical protein [Listeria monocytogenes]